jgi:hypothetical protein
VLVETEVGRTRAVGNAIQHITPTFDTITGPCHVIVELELTTSTNSASPSPKDLQSLDGVQRTTTCLSVNL